MQPNPYPTTIPITGVGSTEVTIWTDPARFIGRPQQPDCVLFVGLLVPLGDADACQRP